MIRHIWNWFAELGDQESLKKLPKFGRNQITIEMETYGTKKWKEYGESGLSANLHLDHNLQKSSIFCSSFLPTQLDFDPTIFLSKNLIFLKSLSLSLSLSRVSSWKVSWTSLSRFTRRDSLDLLVSSYQPPMYSL